MMSSFFIEKVCQRNDGKEEGVETLLTVPLFTVEHLKNHKNKFRKSNTFRHAF